MWRGSAGARELFRALRQPAEDGRNSCAEELTHSRALSTDVIDLIVRTGTILPACCAAEEHAALKYRAAFSDSCMTLPAGTKRGCGMGLPRASSGRLRPAV
jgi:hypothetical protein